MCQGRKVGFAVVGRVGGWVGYCGLRFGVGFVSEVALVFWLGSALLWSGVRRFVGGWVVG